MWLLKATVLEAVSGFENAWLPALSFHLWHVPDTPHSVDKHNRKTCRALVVTSCFFFGDDDHYQLASFHLWMLFNGAVFKQVTFNPSTAPCPAPVRHLTAAESSDTLACPHHLGNVPGCEVLPGNRLFRPWSKLGSFFNLNLLLVSLQQPVSSFRDRFAVVHQLTNGWYCICRNFYQISLASSALRSALSIDTIPNTCTLGSINRTSRAEIFSFSGPSVRVLS
jgi:hypothetical protein